VQNRVPEAPGPLQRNNAEPTRLHVSITAGTNESTRNASSLSSFKRLVVRIDANKFLIGF